MYTKMKSRFFLVLQIAFLAGLLLLSACAPAAAVTDLPLNTITPTAEEPVQIQASATAVPATEVPATEVPATAVSTMQPSSDTGTAVTFGPLSLVVPAEVAGGASGSDYPRIDSEDAAWWQKTPGHLQVMLGDYYVLQGKFHQPQIYVYPAQAYAELVPAAFESIRRLDNILYGSGGPISGDELPIVPFFNAQPLFAANIQPISFQNGGGVRFLTQYDQYNAPVNNHELFYQFQGVTRDGAYYIIAILPITAPVLAETSDAGADLPSGGIAYPDITDPNADWQGYYTAVSDLLNSTSPDAFTPSINQLDLMIESMQVAP
ncbi:MAG: hypothetical protein IAF02_18425 [Anaerolineae bacterium]|nr:hypothetical protein [Anaerolineae bacterium]